MAKTISGHNGNGFSLAHNNRDFIAKNIDVSLEGNNKYYVAAGKNAAEGIRFATLEEIYEKVFEPSWREFQARQRADRKSKFGSYLEEIKGKRAEEDDKLATVKRKIHKTKAVAYETIFQIGNQEDTNILNHSEDARKASELLDGFSKHLLKLPYVHVVTTKELEDPTWEPPGNAGLLVVNLTLHGDEPDGCYHNHLTYIPYFKSNRGQSIQTGIGKTFEALGYASSFVEKLDEKGQKIPKKTKDGAVRTDKKGNVIYEKENLGAGVYDWIEMQKEVLEAEMKAKFGWEREYQGERPTPTHVDTPEYKAMKEREKLKALQLEHSKLLGQKGKLEIENDDLKGENARLREKRDKIADDIGELKTVEEYQAQVKANDEIEDDIENGLKDVCDFAEQIKLPMPFFRELVDILVQAFEGVIQKLKLDIARLRFFEKAKHWLFGEGKLEPASPRQERRLEDTISDAYRRSGATNKGQGREKEQDLD